MNNNSVVARNNLPPLASQQQHQSEGIDIRDALSILSSRTPHVHHDCRDKDSQRVEGSCCRSGADKEMKNMGQTIDLFAPKEASVDPSQSSSTDTTTVTDARNNSIQQRQKLREGLRDLLTVDLLKMVLKCQEDRVKTYGSYNKALKTVLLSRKLTDYPPACLSATAAFFVLSDTVMAIRDEVSTRIENKNDTEKKFETSIVRSICELQSSEREKLQLTAAFHLEQIRVNNVKQQQQHDDDDDDGNSGEEYQRELSLLNKGLDDLRSRIATCKSNINDMLEDLRCCLMEKLEENETDHDIQL